MLAKFKGFVKDHLNEILLAGMVALISLFSFTAGFLIAKYQEKEPIRVEYNKSYLNIPPFSS
ncbi:MAG: hypothetical protein Q8N16_00500 [bacterium]|nr:hypothetical protein [bacterium]